MERARFRLLTYLPTRLQTRERYVKIAEQSLAQKKKHRQSCRIHPNCFTC